ncbi:MAG: NAD(P)/FAD-dependent oxidoreductase, partial [Eubacteriales bacterium]|nr:NAD(P)/FAD-dependent oxidoreductase [Eubacteriales bacterium]
SRFKEPVGAKLLIDLKPGLSYELLDARLLRDIEAGRQKNMQNTFSGLLPHKLLPVVFACCNINGDMPAGELTKPARRALLETLKALPLTVKCARPLNEAIITRGGVSVKEISPSTLESKLVPGLYVGGELLDVDAYTGGFNLQIAWCTGCLAGQLKGETV